MRDAVLIDVSPKSFRFAPFFQTGLEARVFLPLRLREAWTLSGLTPREAAVQTWKKISEHEILTRAAAIAFYAMLALVPFLGLVLTLAVQFLPDITCRNAAIDDGTVKQLEEGVSRLFPREISGLVIDQIARIQSHPPVGLLSIGLVLSLWLASSLYLEIIEALNRVQGLSETRSLVHLRLVAALMTILQAVVLLGSFLTIVLWPQILRSLHLGDNPAVAIMVTVVKFCALGVMILLSFALTYFVAPAVKQRWEWISPGSFIGSILFLATSYAFRIYVQNWGHYDKTYGSLAGVMAMLFWMWLISVILLGGAQLNQVIKDASSIKDKPPEHK